MLQAEPAVPGTNIGGHTMIKKYIENTEEIQQRLTKMLMQDAKEMCRYQRDIYMYIDEDGRARLEWFSNFDGKCWIDDDHYLLYVCMPHYDDIEDDATEYADQADRIMRSFCRKSIDDAQRIEDMTDTVPIVWLFVIDADDQRAQDKQREEVRAMSETRSSRQAKYLERNGLVQINMTVPVEVRDLWKREAISRGMSIKQMLIEIVNVYLKLEKNGSKQVLNAVYGIIAKEREE